MGGVEAEHQPVEEPAAPAGPFDEQPVHLRGQPRQGDSARQGRSGPGRDGRRCGPDAAPTGLRLSRRGRCRSRPGRTGFRPGGDRPAALPAPPAGRRRRHRPAWRGAGRGRATGSDGFQQVGLAGAVRSGQHDGPRVGVQPRALVAAEPRQCETRHRQLRSRTLIRPDSVFCPGISSGRIAQRHRNSSHTRDTARQGPYRRDHASGVAALSQRFGNSARQTRIGIRTYRADGSATSRTIVGDAASAMVNRAPSPSIC